MKYLPLLLLSLLLHAAPAYMLQRSVILTDGSTLKVSLRGDEYLNWFETDTGAIILYNKANGRFEHAQIVDNDLRPSGVVYAPSSGSRQAASLHPDVNKSELRKIWIDKRREAVLQRLHHR